MYDIIVVIKPNGNPNAADMVRQRYPNAITLRGVSNLADAVMHARRLSYTSMYWLITDDIVLAQEFDLEWHAESWDRVYPHAWQAADTTHEFSGIYLIPGDYKPSDEEMAQGNLNLIKPMTSPIVNLKTFDVFFISYYEPTAAANLSELKKHCNRVQHVSNVDGIGNAHRRCAEISTTSMFWTVDADTIVDDGFDFNWRPIEYDTRYLHLWQSRNPCNGLTYGYGGIKLWPRNAVVDFSGTYLDYTTSLGQLKLMPDVVSASAYNMDEKSAWRSGFREGVKLTKQVAEGSTGDSLDRLMSWLQVKTDAPFAQDSCNGAAAGVAYFLSGEPATKINDFGWLEMQFGRLFGTKYLSISRSDLLGEVSSRV